MRMMARPVLGAMAWPRIATLKFGVIVVIVFVRLHLEARATPKPTRVRMTEAGRAAFAAYLEAIGKLVGGG
jgi:hypothetical protein